MQGKLVLWKTNFYFSNPLLITGRQKSSIASSSFYYWETEGVTESSISKSVHTNLQILAIHISKVTNNSLVLIHLILTLL